MKQDNDENIEHNTKRQKEDRYENMNEKYSYKESGNMPTWIKTRKCMMDVKKLRSRMINIQQSNKKQSRNQIDYEQLKLELSRVVKKSSFRVKQQKQQKFKKLVNRLKDKEAIQAIAQLCIKKQPLRKHTENSSFCLESNNILRLPKNLGVQTLSKSLSLKKNKNKLKVDSSSDQQSFTFTQIHVPEAEQSEDSPMYKERQVGVKKKNKNFIPNKTSNIWKKVHRQDRLLEKNYKTSSRSVEKVKKIILPKNHNYHQDYKLKGWETKNSHRQIEHDQLNVKY